MDPRYPTNVKIPEEYVHLIDENLQLGSSLNKSGFKSRAHFVRTAVYEYLLRYGIRPSVQPESFREQ